MQYNYTPACPAPLYPAEPMFATPYGYFPQRAFFQNGGVATMPYAGMGQPLAPPPVPHGYGPTLLSPYGRAVPPGLYYIHEAQPFYVQSPQLHPEAPQVPVYQEEDGNLGVSNPSVNNECGVVHPDTSNVYTRPPASTLPASNLLSKEDFPPSTTKEEDEGALGATAEKEGTTDPLLSTSESLKASCLSESTDILKEVRTLSNDEAFEMYSNLPDFLKTFDPKESRSLGIFGFKKEKDGLVKCIVCCKYVGHDALVAHAAQSEHTFKRIVNAAHVFELLNDQGHQDLLLLASMFTNVMLRGQTDAGMSKNIGVSASISGTDRSADGLDQEEIAAAKVQSSNQPIECISGPDTETPVKTQKGSTKPGDSDKPAGSGDEGKTLQNPVSQ